MADFDYVVYSNSANTDTVPDFPDELRLQYDNEVDSVGSSIVYGEAGPDFFFTLEDGGHYLVIASEFLTAPGTGGSRLNSYMSFWINSSSELVEGWSTQYIRKSGGTEEAIHFSCAIVDVDPDDELQVRIYREDDGGGGNDPDRTPGDRSGIAVIKLPDDWDYARYEHDSEQSSSGSDNTRVTANIQDTQEEDSVFSRSGNTVTINTDNAVLACFSINSNGGFGSRAEYQLNAELEGASVPGSWTHAYIRNNGGCVLGGGSAMFLLQPTSGDELDIGITTRENGGEEFMAALQLVELPDTAKFVIAQATSGDFNAAATDFVWDTADHVDDIFEHTAGTAPVELLVDGPCIVMASMADTDNAGTSVTRAIPAQQFRVNTTDDETAGHSCYVRGSGTADHGATAVAALLSGLSAGDTIQVRSDRIGPDTSSIACDEGRFTVLSLDSLAGAVDPPSGAVVRDPIMRGFVPFPRS